MTSRRIVLDANILIRAMLGVKVGKLLTEYAESIDFCAPSVAFEDAEANLPGIMAKRGIGPTALSLGLDAVRLLVEEIPSEVTEPIQEKALQRIGRRDPDDWPIVAAALALDCPIWTEDKDFFGAGVATWTSELVEIYLRGDESLGVADD
ncbi:PIN domain-containing protein [Microbacterium sp. 18062]|uniref:PIN domain-containing protein n=1 Tax=Microbacterium sp. 18062 TaxID=2681410 RepID=UPI0013575374|nr:PIN domain-containing protein [Microbacterium sp. 18062]